MLRATIASLPLTLWMAFAVPPPVAAAEPSPAYKIISEDGADERRSVSVRLAARLRESEIRRLADGLVARRRPSSAAGSGAGPGIGRIIFKFYLDGMTVDQSPWATATYQSELKIAISGLKLEEEELYLSELRNDRRQLVGAWLTSPPAVPGRLAIFRDKGKVFAEWRLRNGLKTVDELDESRVNRGRRYDVKGENAGHFVVTAAGTLELRDADKLIAVAERVSPDKLVPQAPVSAGPNGSPATGAPPQHATPATLAGPGRAAGAGDGRAASAADPEAAAPVTASVPKSLPQAKKRVVRTQPPRPLQSAARLDSGPVMRLQGQ
ncbi:MAG: hypothetical protein ABL908_05110 [Hyphomicrobium sp.]